MGNVMAAETIMSCQAQKVKAAKLLDISGALQVR